MQTSPDTTEFQHCPQRRRYVTALSPSPPIRYCRADDLPRLLPLWAAELADTSIAGRTQLVEKLYAALRRERRRGVACDWCYDLARHRQLLIAYKAERAALVDAKCGVPR